MEIRPLQRYKALGNAIALPCADYIMAGIYEVLADRAGKDVYKRQPPDCAACPAALFSDFFLLQMLEVIQKDFLLRLFRQFGKSRRKGCLLYTSVLLRIGFKNTLLV